MFRFSVRICLVAVVFTLVSCGGEEEYASSINYVDTQVTDKPEEASGLHYNDTPAIRITDISKDELVRFAETLKGIPYKYGSTDPREGFDCSGFITYVFNKFSVKVPRSSIDFTNVGTEKPLDDAQRGDLILFTGTDSSIRVVGHMGIVTSNRDTLKFIHSTSGRAYGVTETPLNNYYMGRFVKIIDIF